MNKNYQIKSKNFTLRFFKEGDKFSLAKNINDKTIAKNTLTIPYPYTLKNAQDWIKINLAELKKKKPNNVNFVVEIDNEVAGSVGFSNIEGHKAEIGCWLARRYRNKGIMTEAMKLTIKFGFDHLKLKRIYAYVFPWNNASMRMNEKIGLKFEGVLRKNVKKNNKFVDDFLFSIVK